MKKPDYLVMCSQCEVRIHPDDYEKHKAGCQQKQNYIPMPYPVYPQPYDPYPYRTYPLWEWQPYLGPTYTGTAADKLIIGDYPDVSITYGGSSCDAGTTLIC